ncbi:hypothetical protein [Actinomadura sp. WMMB 499]|uniref:hypothetical protein n=1 Tax=Actinomadura sp. WMMB 499 TaxID=1219491 RepID=UPI0012460E1E|nr:hypothetical protein [Actinomadura sp. WMMB 499]QFG25879.1 hypothetical protein F7P10_36790 [Actinomadura sp. WMMB 499]
MRDGSLAALVVLGAFHGLNPAMGWLFAVTRGLQERGRAPVVGALPPIAAGHAASIGAVAVLVSLAGTVVPPRTLAVGGGVLLVGFGLWLLTAGRRAGHRPPAPVGTWRLAGWSFVMSSMHGAGLMLVPLLTPSAAPAVAGHHDHGLAEASGSALSAGIFVTAVHTLAMLAVAGIVAVLVYELVGPAILRRTWWDLDRLWAAALLLAGAFTLVTAA